MSVSLPARSLLLLISLCVAVCAQITRVSLESVPRSGGLDKAVLGSHLQQKFSRNGTIFYSHLWVKDSFCSTFFSNGCWYCTIKKKFMSISCLKNKL